MVGLSTSGSTRRGTAITNMGGWCRPPWNRRPVRRHETQPWVRAVPVEVLRVVSKDPLEVSAAQDECPVQALRADGAHPSLRMSVGIRSPDRRAEDPGPTCFEHRVEGPRELGVAVPDQEPHGGLLVIERRGDVAGLLGDPGRIGVPSHWGYVHPPGAELEEDERVQRLQPDRLHSEEVNRDDSPRLLAEELPPRRPSSGSGPEAVRPEDRGDGCRRDPDPQAEELSLDPLVPPPRVLSGEAKDQTPGPRIGGRSAAAPVRLRPLPGHEPPVPPKERLRANEERAPRLSGKEPARCREERLVGASITDRHTSHQEACSSEATCDTALRLARRAR